MNSYQANIFSFASPSQSDDATFHGRSLEDHHERETNVHRLHELSADNHRRSNCNINRDQLRHDRLSLRAYLNARLQLTKHFLKESSSRYKNSSPSIASCAGKTFFLPFSSRLDLLRHVQCPETSVNCKFTNQISKNF